MAAMAKRTLKLAGALGHLAADKRVEILRRVGQAGSISQAARDAGVSYKAAWQALDTLSNLAGAALVERAVGGSGGGGAQLTVAGRQLLQAAGALVRARDEVLARIKAAPGVQAGAAALALRTSMRNQLPCTVRAIEGRGALQRVALELPGGATLVARITAESVELLGLAPGLGLLALCKATAVQVHKASAPAPAGEGLNLLIGQVRRVARGELGDEVAVQLGNGQQVVGFAAPGSGLRAGSRVQVAVHESAVVLALAG
jgi:molybdate transport system regulatory protein